MATYIENFSTGYQQITSLSSATKLTIPTGTTFALVTPESQAVRWRDDATAPTATVGYPLPVGAELRYDAQQLWEVQFIEQAASAKLNITYYGTL